MKKYEKITYGIIITILIFLIAGYFGKTIKLNSEFISPSFGTHSIMLVLSILCIVIFRKNLNYKIALPKFKNILRPILFGFLVTIIANMAMSIIMIAFGETMESHPLLTSMNVLQILVFVFIYASIAEELLFRGFLLNFLAPLKEKGFSLFKRKISLPVIISAIAFGLSHLILIFTGVNASFLVRVVVFATLLGIVAGYYQEKYDNNAYAIIVHMAGNSIGVIAVLLISPEA